LIVDGEAVACDDNGVASFDLVGHHGANGLLYAWNVVISAGAAPRGGYRLAGSDLGERWSSGLVATAEEDRLNAKIEARPACADGLN
jgi:hypothetical protein